MNNQFIEYGKKGNSKELKEILSHIFNRNNELSELEKKGTPICIWGTHGLGKTQIIRDYALEKKSLLKYCELDTMAMVMIFEHFLEKTK